jgi:oligopeptidase A
VDLKGYDEDKLAKVKSDNGYEISLQAPIYMDVMVYADKRDLREEVYKAYVSRASEVGITDKKFDNKAIMDEILILIQVCLQKIFISLIQLLIATHFRVKISN